MSPKQHKQVLETTQPVATPPIGKTTNTTLAGKVVAHARLDKAAHVVVVAAGWLRLSALLHWLAKVAEPVGGFFEHRVSPGFGTALRMFLDAFGWAAAKLGRRADGSGSTTSTAIPSRTA